MLCKSAAVKRLLFLLTIAIAGSAQALAPFPIVHVTTDITGNLTTIQTGQTATINVRAVIENPASANDGIFSFDQDLILANILIGQPSVLAVQSVTRPGADGFVGSNGTINSVGVQSIFGGYLLDTIGIGSPALLFSVVVKGIGVGTDHITPGPSVDPLGFDFVLYQSNVQSTGVTYDNGVFLQVIAGSGGTGGGGGITVPLPPAVFQGLFMVLLATPMARRKLKR